MTMISDDFVGSISEPRPLIARRAGQAGGVEGASVNVDVDVVTGCCTVADFNILVCGMRRDAYHPSVFCNARVRILTPWQ